MSVGSAEGRARDLIRMLGLEPHPEGGLFRETFRSSLHVRGPSGTERSALTTIYFLVPAGAWSRWHRVAHDEAWHFLEGEPLELLSLDPSLERLERRVLSRLGEPGEPMAVVPAGHWQAARARHGFALVGCTVAPGFDPEDFVLMKDRPEVVAEMERRHAALASLA
jgi:predicted cupin superfamily sugar epimerase